jgi:phage gp29-like protein
MTILDQFGRAIPAADIRRLREEEVTPSLAGVRTAWAGHPADGITPARLAAILRDAAQGNAMRYLELAEELEERDLHYAGVLATRKRSVTQLPITVVEAGDDAASIEHAEFIRAWVETEVLQDALFDILDGVGKGFSVHEIIWETGPNGFRPARLTYRPQRWFDVANGFQNPAEAEQPGADPVEIGDAIMLREAATLAPLLPHKFLVHRHKAKSGLIMRSGLARVACWAWMFKAFTMRDWAAFVSNYGQPLRVGRYGPESSAEDRRVLWRAVSNIAGDCAAIIPRGMEIEFVEPGDIKQAAEIYEKRADWLDRQVSKLVLGQTATTDAIAGGHAVGQEHRLVQEDIERADARMLSVSITRQLVQSIIAFNFGPQKRYPRLSIGRPDEVPLKEVVEGVAKLVPLGLRVGAGQLRNRLGLDEPEGDEEVLAPRPVPVPPQPGVAPAKPGVPGRDTPTPDATDTAAQRALHNRQPLNPEHVDALTERLALDAQGALGGLVGEIRRVVEEAQDMQDLASRIAVMQLDPAQMALVLGRGFAIAHLAGQAALLDELAPRQP